MPVKVTPTLKAMLVDCVAACTIGACFFWLLLLQHLHLHLSSPHPSVRHSTLFPCIDDNANVGPVRQDLKLLLSYRTERNFPSRPTQDFPCSSATLHTDVVHSYAQFWPSTWHFCGECRELLRVAGEELLLF